MKKYDEKDLKKKRMYENMLLEIQYYILTYLPLKEVQQYMLCFPDKTLLLYLKNFFQVKHGIYYSFFPCINYYCFSCGYHAITNYHNIMYVPSCYYCEVGTTIYRNYYFLGKPMSSNKYKELE